MSSLNIKWVSLFGRWDMVVGVVILLHPQQNLLLTNEMGKREGKHLIADAFPRPPLQPPSSPPSHIEKGGLRLDAKESYLNIPQHCLYFSIKVKGIVVLISSVLAEFYCGCLGWAEIVIPTESFRLSSIIDL